MAKHMILSNGVAYVEAPEITDAPCIKCHMLHINRMCIEAESASITVFGNDCVSRKVIYIKADPQPKATP